MSLKKEAQIGITTAIIPDAQNIGLVIPINLAKSVISSLLKEGRIIRSWLGFHGQFIDDNLKGLPKLPLTAPRARLNSRLRL